MPSILLMPLNKDKTQGATHMSIGFLGGEKKLVSTIEYMSITKMRTMEKMYETETFVIYVIGSPWDIALVQVKT